MGQYYKVLVTDEKGQEKIYEPNGLKLIEHSWWYNPFCSTIAKKLFDKPHKIAWVGDYSNEDSDRLQELGIDYSKIWGEENERAEISKLRRNELDLDTVKYLVNVDKEIFIDLKEYKEASQDRDGNALFPLSLLTALGNGKGGGDYFGEEGEGFVGYWANDTIYFSNTEPKSYEKVDISFWY